MVCNKCKHCMRGYGPKHMPYPEIWCSKDHWTGFMGDSMKEDPWKDCKDFEEKE